MSVCVAIQNGAKAAQTHTNRSQSLRAVRTQSVGFDGDDGGGGPDEAAEPKAAGREDVSSTSWTKALRLEEKELRAKKEEFGLDTVEKARLKFLARVKRRKKRSDSTRRLIARESSDKAEAEL